MPVWIAEELPRIKSKRDYEQGGSFLPTWRITCFFAAKTHRRQGVASSALDGALMEIARLGGGSVDAYPEDTEGRSVAGAFLFNGPLGIFDQQGFTRTRLIGKNRWVVTKQVH